MTNWEKKKLSEYLSETLRAELAEALSAAQALSPSTRRSGDAPEVAHALLPAIAGHEGDGDLIQRIDNLAARLRDALEELVRIRGTIPQLHHEGGLPATLPAPATLGDGRPVETTPDDLLDRRLHLGLVDDHSVRTKATASGRVGLKSRADVELGADDLHAAEHRTRVEIAQAAIGPRPRSRSACWVHIANTDGGRVRIDTCWLPIDDAAKLSDAFKRDEQGFYAAEVAPIALESALEHVFRVFNRRLFGGTK